MPQAGDKCRIAHISPRVCSARLPHQALRFGFRTVAVTTRYIPLKKAFCCPKWQSLAAEGGVPQVGMSLGFVFAVCTISAYN